MHVGIRASESLLQAIDVEVDKPQYAFLLSREGCALDFSLAALAQAKLSAECDLLQAQARRCDSKTARILLSGANSKSVSASDLTGDTWRYILFALKSDLI